MTVSSPGTSDERTANPSRTERGRAGMSRSAEMFSARMRPAAQSRPTVSAGGVACTRRRTVSRASRKVSGSTSSLYWGLPGELARAAEHIHEHLFGELAGGGVLLAWVVGADEDGLARCREEVAGRGQLGGG